VGHKSHDPLYLSLEKYHFVSENTHFTQTTTDYSALLLIRYDVDTISLQRNKKMSTPRKQIIHNFLTIKADIFWLKDCISNSETER